ncbi:MAG: 1,4-dihydroxy-2-naphthoate polyprenyltransferase [Ignavibacterium sp.]
MIDETNPTKLQIWILAARPKTLFAAFVPVIVGASLAYSENEFNFLVSFLALICSLLIQIGANFSNDLQDYLKGSDTENRVGPTRALSSGWVSVKQMERAIFLVNFIAFLIGLYLVFVGGLIILFIGIFCIIAELAYTSGPYPLGYHGLGDVFTFVCFGIAGTVGTYILNTHYYSNIALISSIPVGALITNILVVNNFRDYEEDKKSGKNTLTVKLGKTFALYEFIFLLIASFLIPLIMYINYDLSVFIFLPYLSLPIAYKITLMLLKLQGKELNKALALTSQFSAIFGVLFSIGFIL